MGIPGLIYIGAGLFPKTRARFLATDHRRYSVTPCACHRCRYHRSKGWIE